MTALPNPWISNPEPVDRKFRTTDPVSAAAPAPSPPAAAADPIRELFVWLDDHRFILNVERFMLEIDEPPMFLRRARG